MMELGVDFYGKEEAELPPDQVPLVIVGTNDSGSPPWEGLNDDTDEESLKMKTIGGNVDRFLAENKRRVDRGDMSHGRYDSLRCCLEKFAEWKGIGELAIDAIDGPMLTEYRDFLQGESDQERCSPAYAKTQLQSVKQFVNWCWEQELLELPRILQSSNRKLSISARVKEIGLFSLDELKLIFDESTEVLRLYLLLMCNTGMQQQDIAELRQDEVDWTKGRVTRKRGKTANHEGVPVVSYPLWEETFQLLNAHRSNHPALALTNIKGQPLKTEEIVGGKVRKSDNIRSAYNRVLVRLAARKPPVKIDKPLKLLRKTAASKLAEHPEYGRYAQHFLGHAPRTIADRHYVRPSEEQFDRAVRWLGHALGLVSDSDTPEAECGAGSS